MKSGFLIYPARICATNNRIKQYTQKCALFVHIRDKINANFHRIKTGKKPANTRLTGFNNLPAQIRVIRLSFIGAN